MQLVTWQERAHALIETRKEWLKNWGDDPDSMPETKARCLLTAALDPETVTHAQLKTCEPHLNPEDLLVCDECGRDTEAAVILGDYDLVDNTVTVCHDCMRAALTTTRGKA